MLSIFDTKVLESIIDDKTRFCLLVYTSVSHLIISMFSFFLSLCLFHWQNNETSSYFI